MPEEYSRLTYLLQRYADNNCTRAEWQELMDMIDEAGDDDELAQALKLIWNKTGATDPIPAIDKEQIFKNVIASGSVKPLKSRRHLFVKWAAAAIILLFVGLGANRLFQPANNGLKNTTYTLAKIKPGTDKATLTLADGRAINFAESDTSILLNGGEKVISFAKGRLTYKEADKSIPSTAYNTLTTPRGGQYRIQLPDGTNVWLNASSKLRFPGQFTASQRVVELEGEGYFEVAKNKAKPFIVNVNNTQVKVLGTHFNIMGYADESSTNTTLLEGSVQITSGKRNVLLKPGEQAKVKDGIKVNQVDVTPFVAWKNGNFNFEHENIESIMRKLSRWYNIEVKYEGKITNEGFVGKLPRSKNLSEVLDILEATGLVHFKVEERSVTVMP